METTVPPAAGSGPAPAPYRRAYRPVDHRLLGGVAAGIAEHLGIGVVVVRTVFVVAAFFNGAGAIAYLVLWRLLPLREPEEAPGLEAAARSGMRARRLVGTTELVRTLGILAVGAGVVALLATTGFLSWAWLVPSGLAVGGVALIWRQLDDARRTGGAARLPAAARLLGGTLLVAGAVAYVVTRERGWTALGDAVIAGGAALAGLGLILGPWIYSLLGDLSEERRERIRSQERADVAAHLHDSVLQTLALLQKHAHDPAQVATLARRQERDLRAWLYGEDTAGADSLAAALRATASETEEAHRVPVEVVVVGDAPLDPDLSALVAASREAVVNAAKHARVERIDVYAECTGEAVSVFVRDRGVGFDPALVADDRMGLRGSIVGRIQRHGGTVEVRTAPGEGTEIRLSMPMQRENNP